MLSKKNILNFSNHIKKNFIELNKKKETNNIILVEFHAWCSSHICYSYLLNSLKKKYLAKIVAYEGYTLISKKIYPNIFEKLKWNIGKEFKINNFKVYDSLGTTNFIRVNVNSKIIQKAKKIYKLQKFNSKSKLLDFKINNIIIGDLIYDTYLKIKKLPTINLNDAEFKNFFYESLLTFFYWQDYIKTNSVKAVIISHSTYTYGIIMRVALNYNIPVYKPNFYTIYKISQKNYFIGKEFFEFKKLFNSLNKKEKKIGLFTAKRHIDLMFRGKNKTGLGYNFNRLKIPKNSSEKKIKVMIAMHNFYDSPHVFGRMLFPDFYEWLKYIINLSKKTDYNWYLKLHPENTIKDIKYIKKLLEKNNQIKIISHKTNQNQIIKSGIKYVLTCFGSIGYEYAYKNITVINACINNPHADYNFTLNPRSIKEFEKIILNIKKYKIKPDKKEILEFLFIRRFYSSLNWLNFEEKIFNTFKNGFGWDKLIYRTEVYIKWIKNFKINKHLNTIQICDKFVKSNYFKLNPIHLKDSHYDKK